MKKRLKSGFSLIEISIVILIIGVLVAGVITSSGLVRKSKLATARNTTSGSDVHGIEGLVGWWESTGIKSFADSETKEGSTITTWYEANTQTSFPKNLTQSDSGLRPIYRQSAINGLPGLQFNGSSQYLSLAYSPDLNPRELTIFVVAKTPPATESGGSLLSSYGTGAFADVGGYGLFSSTSNFQFYTVDGYAEFANDVDTPSILSLILSADSLYGANVGSSEADYNALTMTTFKNGAYTSRVGTSGEAEGGQNTDGVFTVGTYIYPGSEADSYYDGYIGEIIIFNRVLKDEERNLVEKYLSKKWSINVTTMSTPAVD